MKHYVSLFENVWAPEFCQMVIDKFENNVYQHVDTLLDGHRHFTEITISSFPDWAIIHNKILCDVQRLIELYKNHHEIGEHTWPESFNFEMFRMKRYEPNDKDYFAHHVDVGNHQSAKRFLVFFWYLNDVETGGETTFEHNKNADPWITVKPTQGSVLMFPPLWTYGHTGHKPVSGNKYIIGGYLHYK